MRTPRARNAPLGFGPRATTTALSRTASRRGVMRSTSVAPKSARVPTPVWKIASRAGFASSEPTSSAMVSGSRSGSSASAGACNGTAPRCAMRPASCSPMRASRMAMRLPFMSALAGDARVGERETLGDVANERAHELQLRPQAHLGERRGSELGELELGVRLDGRMARLAARDVRHLAEDLRRAHHVEEPALARHLRLASRQEKKARAALLLAHDRPALGHARPLSGAHELPELRVGEKR